MAARISAASEIVSALFHELQSQAISESDLSARLGVHLNSVSNWRLGRSTPSVIDMAIMANELGFELTLTRRS